MFSLSERVSSFFVARRALARARPRAAMIVAAGLAAATVSFWAWADGQLDTTFGSGGKVQVSFSGSTFDTLGAARWQADGSFWVAGILRPGSTPGNTGYIANVSANGVVVGTPFTIDLKAIFDPATTNNTEADGVSVPADGKVLFAGGSIDAEGYFAKIIRVNASGAVEATFDRPNGAGNESYCGYAMGESPTGKIIATCLVGTASTNVFKLAVIRLNNNLTLDTTFGSGGTAIVTTLPAGATASEEEGGIARDASGNYYVLGSGVSDFTCGFGGTEACNTQLFVAKLTSAGAVDTTFGSSGIVVVATASNASATTGNTNRVEGGALILDSSDRILVGGSRPKPGGAVGEGQGFVARVTTAGALDGPFGSNGIATFGSNNFWSIRDLAETVDGIYALGDSNLYRLTAAGALDTGFDSASSDVYTLNQTNVPPPTDASQWQGLFQIDSNNALLLGGVNDNCAGNSNCGQTFGNPDRAIVAKVQLKNDTTPDAFTFTDQTGVALNSTVTSNTITITGVNAAAPISVSGAAGSAYSIGCTGTFTSTAGTITNGQTVCVRHTSSSAGSTTVNTTLDVGGVTDVFSSTTVAADTTPDPFSFTDQTNVALNSTITSNSITVAGINAGAPISATGGSYSINGGGFTSAAGTVNSGDTVRVQHVSAATPSTSTNTTLTIGGISDTFTSTTGADSTPDPFTFTDQTGVATGSVVTSNTVTVTGMDSPAAVSISGGGGEYSINGGAFTAAAGTITNGQTVAVRVTSSASASTMVSTTLDIGGVTDTFNVTTGASDTTPDPFAFTDQTNVAQGATITSAAITVTGINTGTPISVSGGSYSVGCTGTFITTAGNINNNETVCAQHTSASTSNTATNTVLTIGGVSDTFTSTTTPDTTPDPFTFTDQTNVPRNSVRTSNSITVAGIDVAVSIGVSGGSYSVNGGAFTASAGTVNSGDTVRVQHTSSGSFSTATGTTLTIGGVSDTFTSTTEAQDTQPDAFTFTDVTNAELGSTQTSNTVTITGINDAAPISVSGGTYSIGCSATFTASSGTITSGQTVCVRHTAAGTDSATTSTTLSIGGVFDTFTSTTGDATPAAFSFTAQNGVARSATVTSNTITIGGMTVSSSISVVGGEYSVNGAAFTSTAGSIANGQTVAVRHTSAAGFSSATTTTLTIGGVAGTFTSTTEAQDLTPNAFGFTDQTGLALSTQVTSNAVTIGGINDAAPISVTGGSYSIGCTSTFTSTAGTITNGQTVCVRHTSSATTGTAVNTVLDIGGVTDTFTSTTSGAGALSFDANVYVVNESSATVTITVNRVGGIGGAVGVQFATSDGTATAGSDYTTTGGTLNWANGESTAKTFTVGITNDALEESLETILLALSGPTGGATLGSPATATIEIAGNDAATASARGGSMGLLDVLLGLLAVLGFGRRPRPGTAAGTAGARFRIRIGYVAAVLASAGVAAAPFAADAEDRYYVSPQFNYSLPTNGGDAEAGIGSSVSLGARLGAGILGWEGSVFYDRYGASGTAQETRDAGAQVDLLGFIGNAALAPYASGGLGVVKNETDFTSETNLLVKAGVGLMTRPAAGSGISFRADVQVRRIFADDGSQMFPEDPVEVIVRGGVVIALGKLR